MLIKRIRGEILILCCYISSVSENLYAQEADGRGFLIMVETLMRQPVEQRKLNPDDTRRCVAKLTESKLGYDAMLSALALAWADDEESLEKLRLAQKSNPDGNVGGAAGYAIGLRAWRRDAKDVADYYEALCGLVRATKKPRELLFCANRLWGDFGTRGLPVILEAAKECKDDWIANLLLAYVSETDSTELAKQALNHSWPPTGGFVEELPRILDRIAPCRKQIGDPIRAKSLGKLRATIQKSHNPK